MDENSILELVDVNLTYPYGQYDNIKVISDVSLSIQKNSFVSILGPSGCGKSSLLRVMAGLVDLDSGSVNYCQSISKNMATKMSLNFQKPLLLPWLTVEENILLPFEIANISITTQTKSLLNDLMDLVRLSGFRSALPGQLSGGMQMRAMFVRSFITEPSIVLMDEPFSALDEISRHRLGIELLELANRFKTTIVFVTHSISEAVYLSNRVLLMSPRPAKLIDDVEINFERQMHDRMSKPFNSYCRYLEDRMAHG